MPGFLGIMPVQAVAGKSANERFALRSRLRTFDCSGAVLAQVRKGPSLISSHLLQHSE